MDEKWCRGQEIKIGTCGRMYTRVTLAVLQRPVVDSDGQTEQTMRTDDLHIMDGQFWSSRWDARTQHASFPQLHAVQGPQFYNGGKLSKQGKAGRVRTENRGRRDEGRRKHQRHFLSIVNMLGCTARVHRFVTGWLGFRGGASQASSGASVFLILC